MVTVKKNIFLKKIAKYCRIQTEYLTYPLTCDKLSMDLVIEKSDALQMIIVHLRDISIDNIDMKGICSVALFIIICQVDI